MLQSGGMSEASDSGAGPVPSRETELPAPLPSLYDVGEDSPRNLSGLPRIFHSLAFNLSDAQIAALTALPPTACVVLRVGLVGKRSVPIPVGAFCDDFQLEAAETIGQPGKIIADFQLPDGRPLVTLSFKIDGQAAGLTRQDPVQALIQEFRDEMKSYREEMQVELRMRSVTPQQTLGERLQELKALKEIMRDDSPRAAAENPLALMSESMKAMGTAMGESMKMVQTVAATAQQMNPAQSAGTIEAAKAKAWVDVAKDAMPMVVDGVKMLKGISVKPPAGLTPEAAAAAVEVA